MSVFVTVVVFALFLYSVILHEIAHGWVALKCGDPTAKWEGRLTLNPIPHIDPVWSILVPLVSYFGTGILFGGARPVPVNTRNLRRYPRDWILVSLAGVATNLGIGIVSALLVHLFARTNISDFLAVVFYKTAITNLALLVFNLIPIPPLDGSRAFRFLLKGDLRRSYDSLERYGFLILILFINTPLADRIIYGGIEIFKALLGLDRYVLIA